MTGFASLTRETPQMGFTVEIKGYNSRFLEVSLSISQIYAAFENEIRLVAFEYCRRGKIEIAVRVKEKSAPKFSVNFKIIDAYINMFNQISNYANIENNFSMSDIMRIEGLFETEKVLLTQETWPFLKQIIIEAFKQFSLEREREGAYTQKNILSYIDKMEYQVKEIEKYAFESEAFIRNNIKKRLNELSLTDGIDENRILTEVAFLLVKWTIAEEICRLNSHLEDFRRETADNAAPGKKLDFLCQEIAREINTIGSKSPLIEISRIVIMMKEEIENVREQLRNIE